MPPTFEQTYQSALAAARNGDAKAQLYLAVALMKGLGVAKCEARAFEWCRRSAEQGNIRAQILLGYLHRYGIGCPADERQAHLWFFRSIRDITLNSEVQEALIRYAGMKKLHEDETGTLYRYQSLFGTALFVSVINRTPEHDGLRKRYFIQVPPNMESARQAVAWTFEMHEDDYHPIRET